MKKLRLSRKNKTIILIIVIILFLISLFAFVLGISSPSDVSAYLEYYSSNPGRDDPCWENDGGIDYEKRGRVFFKASNGINPFHRDECLSDVILDEWFCCPEKREQGLLGVCHREANCQDLGYGGCERGICYQN